MAEKPKSDKPLYEVRQEIAHSRDRLARNLEGLRYELNFPLKLRQSFRQKMGLWVGGTAVAGVLLSLMPVRTKTVEVDATGKKKPKPKLFEAGLVLGAAKLVASIIQPAILAILQKKLGALAGGFSNKPPPRA